MVVKPYQWFAWLSTVRLLTAALLAPFNVYLVRMGIHYLNTMWIIVGILWSEKSLIVMNAGLTIIYVAGLLLFLTPQRACRRYVGLKQRGENELRRRTI